MSLWVCAKHGLYGGQIFCPRCGINGAYAEIHHEKGNVPVAVPQRHTRPVDSYELDQLRLRYRKSTPGSHASPARLGRFAADTRTKITDFGLHSKRWIAQFKAGEATKS